MRHAAQCVGRVLRGKTDYGLMIFADKVGISYVYYIIIQLYELISNYKLEIWKN